jgi:excisionase family DNA binding protein
MCAIPTADFDHYSTEPREEPTSTWLTAREAAQYLKLRVRTVLLWARQGKVKAYALTGTQRRVWRFLQVDLDAAVMHRKPVVGSVRPSVLAKERRI